MVAISKMQYNNKSCPFLKRRCNSLLSSANVFFPLELIIDILERLPLKSLLRFRSVCKDWCNLITSPKFIYSHLKRSKQTGLNDVLITRSVHYYVFYPDMMAPNNRSYTFDLPYEFCFPDAYKFRQPHPSSQVVGDCDGLLCIYAVDAINNLALCNPVTGDFRILPPPDDEDLHTYSLGFSIGFGYDCINDDYKVVKVFNLFYPEKGSHNEEDLRDIGEAVARERMLHNEPVEVVYNEKHEDVDELAEFEIKVYSMRSNTWRKIRRQHDSITPAEAHFPSLMGHMGVFLNDTLHFPMIRKVHDAYCILTYDFRSERLGCFPMPKSPNTMKCMPCLKVLGGCLSSVTNEFGSNKCEIWIMKEYGEADSWSRLFSTEGDSNFHSLISLSQEPRPIAYYSAKKGDDFLLLKDFDNANQLLLYNINERSLEQIRIHNMDAESFPTLFVGSLVQIPDPDFDKQDRALEGLSRDGEDRHKDGEGTTTKRIKIELEEIPVSILHSFF